MPANPLDLIDVHAHIVPKFWQRAQADAGLEPTSGVRIEWSPERALETMDAKGIAAAVLSISFPGVHFGDAAAARALARRCNEASADIIGRYSGRFGGFAVLPMPDVEGSLSEIAFALDNLRLDGVVLQASYGGRFLGDPSFELVLAALHERGTTVFVHPGMHPTSRDLGMSWPGFMLEFVIDTSRAAMNLVFSGALERYANVNFILAHGGGVIPYIAWRLSVAPIISPLLPQWTQEKVFDALKRFWYDTAISADRRSLPSLLETAAPERVLFGSDWPYATTKVMDLSIAGLRSAIPDVLLGRIAYENARGLFPRFAVRKTESTQ